MKCLQFSLFILSLLLYVTGPAAGATAAWWDFEDGADGAAFSSMPLGGSVDIVNGIVLRGYDAAWGPSFGIDTPSEVGLSCRFNGSQDGYTTDVGFNNWAPQTWTIEVSVKLDSVSGWLTLIGRDGASFGGPEADFYLQKNNINGAFRLNFRSADGERYILDSNFAPEAGRWYHLAVVSDGTILTMYADPLDGSGCQVVGSLTMDGATPADNALAADDFNWTFGRGWFNGDFVDRINGCIDNVRFSDAVLTPGEFIGYNPVKITESDGRTLLFAGVPGFTDSYEVALAAETTDNVVVTVQTPAGLSTGSGSGQDTVLTFTPADWDQPRTVTVSVADPLAALDSVETLGHTVHSDDPSYQVTARGVRVEIMEDACGLWGYLEADTNFDCEVNLEDFAALARVWLLTEAPMDFGGFTEDWLLSTTEYDPLLFDRSIQETATPFAVDSTNVLNTIDENVYGHFLEHIYHSANGGLWGELVWNRSFEMTGSGGAIWTIDGNELVQSSLATDVHMEFGNAGWSDYEITLEARKDGGSEAFLIVFRALDSDNFYWCNLGGWDNTQHAVEKEVNGGRSVVSSTVSGSIPTGEWVDIRIRCEGSRFRVWLDEANNPDPLFDFTDSSGAYLTGRVGLGTWATAARYRNIQVTGLPSTNVLFSGLPAVPDAGFGADFWSVFGGASASISSDALNDDYAVRIVSTGGETGLVQDDFAFTSQAYHGSLWMKGTLAAGVRVDLLDGTTVIGQATLPAPTAAWAEYPFQVTPTAARNDGRLRITLLGAGTVTIDQVSLMGQDALDTGGFRPDLLAAVDGLRPPIIRWPGGCFASAYFWKDGIGAQHERKKYAINLWDDQDTNSYGTDEFLRMCEAIDAEPLICINTGLLNGTCGVSIPFKLTPEEYLQDALDWMEYCNGDAQTTYWGGVRAANGHPEPYNVTWWEIDNEVWSTGYGGGIVNYIPIVQTFAPAMQAKAAELGTPIQLIACGGGSYDMGWNRALIDACAPLMDSISVHHYEGADGYKSGPITYDSFLAELSDYIAGSANPEMKIYNSEWNLQTTDWRTGLYAGGILNVYEKHGDTFTLGGPALFLRHTSATGWDNSFINFDHTGWFAAPNYVVMKLWRDHYAPYRVETTGGDANLNVVTVMSEDEQTLTIRIVNADAVDKSVAFEIDASFVPDAAYIEYVAPGSLYARNTLAEPDAVRVEAKVVGIDGRTLRFLMPAYSTGVVTVKTAQPHVTGYLYSSFRNNGEDGLHLAYSGDGLDWTALNNDASFLAPQVGSRLIRDPSICRGPDGMFHMVWTTGWWDDGIGVAHSADLIHWSEQAYLPVMAHEPEALNCWAPEIFYDEATDTFLIFWSTTIPGRFPETDNPNDDNNHRIYCTTTRDFVTYTPTRLFYDPGFNVIDAFIAKDGDRYVMFIKHESKSPTVEKNIRIAFADHAAGPYGPASESISPAWVEGPSAMRIGSQWRLYYDGYTRGRMEGQVNSDLDTWTDMTDQLSFPNGTRHGTVFPVDQAILRPLLELP